MVCRRSSLSLPRLRVADRNRLLWIRHYRAGLAPRMQSTRLHFAHVDVDFSRHGGLKSRAALAADPGPSHSFSRQPPSLPSWMPRTFYDRWTRRPHPDCEFPAYRPTFPSALRTWPRFRVLAWPLFAPVLGGEVPLVGEVQNPEPRTSEQELDHASCLLVNGAVLELSALEPFAEQPGHACVDPAGRVIARGLALLVLEAEPEKGVDFLDEDGSLAGRAETVETKWILEGQPALGRGQ